MNKNLKLLWNFMTGNRSLYIASIIAVGFATIFSYISPLIVRISIDSIIGDQPLEVPEIIKNMINSIGGVEYFRSNLWICALMLISLTILSGLFQFFKGKWSAQASESITKKIRNQLYDHLQRLSFDYHIKAETGDLIQRCTSDLETVRRFLAVQFVEIGRALFMVALVIPIMLYLDVRMTLISMTVIPLIFAFSVVFFIKIKKAFQLSDEAEGKMSTVLQENLTGVRVVRAFGRQRYETDKFDKRNHKFKDLTYHLIVLLAWYWSASDLLCLLQIAGVLITGIYWAATGSLTLGTLFVFITYESMLLWPVRQMGRILTDMGKATVSINRIQEILDEPIEQMEATGKKPEISGNIEFENVNFKYEENNELLKNISFKAQAGQTIAILGPTGSGKTSLVHLLARLYDYQSGSIKIDGNELKEIDKKWIRENVGLVLQEPFLFSRTLKENIGIISRDKKDQSIYEAAKVASIHDVILNFDDGYETAVGEKGVTLSGGQKQRVAIARTLINDTPILIFDDSLSAVDTETDAAIRKALWNRKTKATTFIISHRITTLSEADLILVLENGELIQTGSHEELLNQEGLYKRIWNIQNTLEEELENELDKGHIEKMDTLYKQKQKSESLPA